MKEEIKEILNANTYVSGFDKETAIEELAELFKNSLNNDISLVISE